MSHSLNEIEALAKRAGRGSGMSWGIAEEAARAVRWLASHELPSVSVLADVLELNDQASRQTLVPMSLDGAWVASSERLCPLASGATLNDCADWLLTRDQIEMTGVSHPLLVVPFAAWAAIHIGAPVEASWLNVRIITDGYGVWINDPENQIATASATALICKRADQGEVQFKQPKSRGEVSQAAWARLGSLAHRTYAPATEASRILGAGAGVSDND